MNMLRLIRLAIAMAAVFPLALHMWSCTSTEPGGTLKENQPPRVWLSAAPPEGTTESYTIRMFWGGWDPDGEIAFYEYKITDNVGGTFLPADTVGPWNAVYANDSTFNFTADLPADTNNTTETVAEFQRSHTFLIRAVDDQGLRSLEPARRSFTSRTLSPRVFVEIPRRNEQNAADVPPIATYSWLAYDFISDEFTQQDPESVQYVLLNIAPFNNIWVDAIGYLRKNPSVLNRYGLTPEQSDAEWEDWVYYKAPNDSGKFWTTDPLDYGRYVFAIRAKDEAGAVTPVLDEVENIRRVNVSGRTTGPTLLLSNDYLGGVVSTLCEKPPVIIDLPAGLPVEFTWAATADHYGGTVPGYRYGWDIADLSDPDQWDVVLTPFPSGLEIPTATSPSRQFNFGTHTFVVEVVDNSGFCSRVTVKINYIQFTAERSLLLVDDYPEGTFQSGWDNPAGRGIGPTDQEHDDFWLEMLDDVEGFNPSTDILQVIRGDEIALPTLAQYKSLIWSVFGARLSQINLPLLYDYIRFRPKEPDAEISGKQLPNLVSLFMAAGGHVFLNGNHPAQLNVSREEFPGVQYPFMFLYDQEGGQDGRPDFDNPPGDVSFGYLDLCLETVDFGYARANSHRETGDYCPVHNIRTFAGAVERDDGMRMAVPWDSTSAFPPLTLRPEAAGPGKRYQPSERSYDVEVYNPQYFFDNCVAVSGGSRWCFEPIYALVSLDTLEATYMQPIAFWTWTYADRVPDVVGGVGAPSVVWGFPPVFMTPSEVKPAIEHILYDVWQLPRRQ